MKLNVYLHCANFVMFSAIGALIVQNAEANSTLAAANSREANGTLFKFINTTEETIHEKTAVNWPPNSAKGNISSSSISPQKIIVFAQPMEMHLENKENRRRNCTNAAQFGQKNDKMKRREKRKADVSSLATAEQISTENGAEEGESERHSSEETSSGEREGNKSSEEETTTANSSKTAEAKGKAARDEAEGQLAGEEEDRKGTNECGNGEEGELLLIVAENENSNSTEEEEKEEFVKSVKNESEKGNNGTVENESNYGKSKRNKTMKKAESDGKERTNTTKKGHSKRGKREPQDFADQANAQLRNAFGNAQTMVQQQQQQMPTQIIQIPSVDLASGKAQNILLISDSGNVSMSRGLHFLTVSTVMQQ